MLRGLVLLLVVANLAFFAWTQGWLDNVVGMRPDGEHEPERLKRQVEPDSVRILSPSAASVPATPAAPPPFASTPSGEPFACLEAGPFSVEQVVVAASALPATLPGSAWADVTVDKPGAWIVYMGRYSDRELLSKKKEELARIKLPFEEVRNSPALEPGLSLGRFTDRNAADLALAQFGTRGVHSAKVVEITPVSTAHMLRVEKADATLSAQLTGLRADALGKGFQACTKAAVN